MEAEQQPVDPGTTTRLVVVTNNGGSEPVDAGGSGGSGQLVGRLGEGLTATWSVDDDAWSIGEQGAAVELTAPESYASTATVSVTVSGDGGSTTDRLEVTTGRNVAPTIADVSADPNPAKPGAEVEMTVQARDERGDELSYSWSAPEGWSFADGGEAAAATLQTPADESASFADVSVVVSDGYEKSSRSETRVQLRENARPIVSSVTATPPQVKPGEQLTLEVVADDPDNGELGTPGSCRRGGAPWRSNRRVSRSPLPIATGPPAEPG